MHKQEVNYRYPEECCGKCIHAYRNSYGDAQCNILEPGNSIDLGAVCDRYAVDTVVATDLDDHSGSVVPSDTVVAEVRPPETGTCTNCVHSGYDGSSRPYCNVDGNLIEDVNARCGAWEEDWDGIPNGSIVPELSEPELD
jgi:hypothetical protein